MSLLPKEYAAVICTEAWAAAVEKAVVNTDISCIAWLLPLVLIPCDPVIVKFPASPYTATNQTAGKLTINNIKDFVAD